MEQVVLQTNYGDIVIELNREKAPITVANFINYVESGHYNGTIFHRVINGFMVQGGGLDSNMQPKDTLKSIKNEADNGLSNQTYTIAMARTNDPDSASSQFFINVKDNNFLDHSAKTATGWGYTVFGKVVKGQDIVDKIEAVKTTRSGHYDDVPVEPVIIEKAATCQN